MLADFDAVRVVAQLARLEHRLETLLHLTVVVEVLRTHRRHAVLSDLQRTHTIVGL